jgi:UDP-N-acetyl-D-glucosamine dehydrogenase
VVDCTPVELAAADLVVLLVDHPDFPLDEVAEHAPLVLDTKGVMRPREFTGETL